MNESLVPFSEFRLSSTKAFRNNSTELFKKAVEEATRLGEIGDIYPPAEFPLPNTPRFISAVKFNLEAFPSTINPTSPWDNISQAEAVAFYVCSQELRAYTTAYTKRNEDLADEICQRDDLLPYEQSDPWEVITGFEQFLVRMSQATWTRHRLQEGQKAPELEPARVGVLVNNSAYTDWGLYREAILRDRMALGPNTAVAAARVVTEYGRNHYGPHISRVNSFKHGGELACNLYREAFSNAATILPASVIPGFSRTSITPEVIQYITPPSRPSRSIFGFFRKKH